MKLSRKFDKILIWAFILSLMAIFAGFLKFNSAKTFADNESGIYIESESKYVTFYDNGERLIVKTTANTVAEALERANITLSSGDIVEPGLDTEINANDFFINIHRAHPVILRDGAKERYLMTASYDIKTIAKEAGITLYDGDEVTPVVNDSFLEAGVANIYEITRNGGRSITEQIEIPFEEVSVKDYTMDAGTSEVRQLGEVGLKEIHYDIQYVNNVEVSRTVVSEEIVRAPVERIVAKGAKKSVAPEQETCASWVRAAGVSEADLSAALDLIYHESGCRVDAENASTGAYGIPQALPGGKMAAYGDDWKTNPVTQIKWMSGYVTERYGGWTQAVEIWYSRGWY